MRDLFLILFVLGMMPVVIFRPYIGLLLWAWISYMNPHRLTWSFAYNFRFNFIIAFFTILGIVYTLRFNIKIPWRSPSVSMLLFTLWTMVTSMTAFRPAAAQEPLDRFIKIQLMIFATYILVQNRRHIIALVAVIALSVGFYGLKGGIFTLLSGGKYRVMGPAHSFFVDNNSFALALVMTLPLIYFLHLQFKNRLMRLLFSILSLLSILSIIGTYSRGGFFGLSVLFVVFILKSRKKWIVLFSMILFVPFVYQFMPGQWHDRMSLMITSGMETLQIKDMFLDKDVDSSYELFFPEPVLNGKGKHVFNVLKHDTQIMADKSVSGRLDAWKLAVMVANDRPFLGGGFGTFEQSIFNKYMGGTYRHAAHSNYFEVIGEQGYFGFILWMILHLSALFTCRWLSRHARTDPELLWVKDLSVMLQVSLIGYYAAGTFLSMAYFDLPYHLIAILVILRGYTENFIKNKQSIQSVAVNRQKHIFSKY